MILQMVQLLSDKAQGPKTKENKNKDKNTGEKITRGDNNRYRSIGGKNIKENIVITKQNNNRKINIKVRSTRTRILRVE